MQIRKEQLRALNEHKARTYELRLAKFLRAQFPDATLDSDEILRRGIVTQIKKAQRYGLVSELAIADYVITAWVLGDEFDIKFPAAQEVLAAQISQEMKALFLERWTEQIVYNLGRSE